MDKISFSEKEIELDDLLLDPNNYRFLDNINYKKKIRSKFHLAEVQKATLRLLEQDKRYQLAELKKSILANGYVPMERIIVVPYEHKKGSYLVVEGNRRVTALKSLLSEEKEGVIELSLEQKKTFLRIPCAILESEGKDLSHAQRVIMGIRHIAGPREWGAYQQAQLIEELRDVEDQDYQSIANHLGISTMEVGRRYRAMRALKEMEKDEHYSDRANFDQYRLFHELISLPDVRAHFGWDEEALAFRDKQKAREFYELIAPSSDDTSPKVRTYSDVRKLKLIVPHPKAVALLLDPERSLTEAIEVAESLARERIDEGQGLAEVMAEISRALSKLDVLAIKQLDQTDISAIDFVITRLEQLKKIGQVK
jgi:hypothetical protein